MRRHVQSSESVQMYLQSLASLHFPSLSWHCPTRGETNDKASGELKLEIALNERLSPFAVAQQLNRTRQATRRNVNKFHLIGTCCHSKANSTTAALSFVWQTPRHRLGRLVYIDPECLLAVFESEWEEKPVAMKDIRRRFCINSCYCYWV